MTYIIAEAGVNHCGGLGKALKLVDAAHKAGAGCVKFQMFTADSLVSKERDPEQWERLKKLELPFSVFRQIKERCEETGIDFLATPFSPDAMTAYHDLGMRTVKIASPDLEHYALLELAAGLFDHIILSTGAAYPEQIQCAIDAVEPGPHITLLHCVSAYPAPAHDTNLRAMATLRERFPQCDVGLSDHSSGYRIALAACAMGAVVLEKHVMLDKGCPDEAVSLYPSEFKDMVDSIHLIERAMGDGIKRPMPSEIPGIARSRRGNDGLRPLVPHV